MCYCVYINDVVYYSEAEKLGSQSTADWIPNISPTIAEMTKRITYSIAFKWEVIHYMESKSVIAYQAVKYFNDKDDYTYTTNLCVGDGSNKGKE
jgi:hypothetical protein